MRISTGLLGVAVCVMMTAAVAAAERPSLFQRSRGDEPAPRAKKVDDDGGSFVPAWMTQLKPRPPRLPSPPAVWRKVNRGTQTMWSATRRAVVAPWQKLSPSPKKRTAKNDDGGFFSSWFGKDDEKPSTPTEWLAQPRPGF